MHENSKRQAKIYVWDNGEDFLDHSVWFIETDLEQDVVEAMLQAAVEHRSRRGGVVAILDPAEVTWRQMRLEPLANWFTCHGDELVDWRRRQIHPSLRRLPISAACDLSRRLYPSNAEIVAGVLGFEL